MENSGNMNICLQTMNIIFHSMLNPSNRRKDVLPIQR